MFVNVVCYMSMSLVCSDSSVFTLTSVSVRVKHVSLMCVCLCICVYVDTVLPVYIDITYVDKPPMSTKT